MMGKEFSNKNSTRMAWIAGTIIGIIGVGLITIHVLLGSLALLSAVIAFILFFYFGTDSTVICNEKGFTVKSESRAKGKSLHEYRWEEVIETHYYDNESEEDHLTTRRILVKTASGPGFNLYLMKGFDELIAFFNQKTTHLPYIWKKPREMSNIYTMQDRSFS